MQFITIRFFVYTLQKYNFSLKYTNKMVFFFVFCLIFLTVRTDLYYCRPVSPCVQRLRLSIRR